MSVVNEPSSKRLNNAVSRLDSLNEDLVSNLNTIEELVGKIQPLKSVVSDPRLLLF